MLCSHGHGGWNPRRRGSVADALLRRGVAPMLVVGATGPLPCPERIVVPLDGSCHAQAALGGLRRLPAVLTGDVTLLRVIGEAGARGEAERYLHDVARDLAEDGVACSIQVDQGDPAACIRQTAQPDKLVVMATHGRSGFSRWMLGSVAESVTNGAVAGVLLIRG